MQTLCKFVGKLSPALMVRNASVADAVDSTLAPGCTWGGDVPADMLLRLVTGTS